MKLTFSDSDLATTKVHMSISQLVGPLVSNQMTKSLKSRERGELKLKR